MGEPTTIRRRRRGCLGPGRIIHFAMSMPDFDTEPGAFHAYATMGSTSLPMWMDATYLVDGILLAADPDSSPTAVQTTTWADIKASFAR